MRLAVLLLLAFLTARAGVFDGTTSYGVMGSSVATTNNDTYCVWMYPTGGGEAGFGRIFDQANYRLFRYTTTGELHGNYYDSATTYATTSTQYAASAWYFVCLTRANSDGGPRIYAGTATTAMTEASYSGRGDSTISAGPFTTYVGNRAAGDRTFAGSLAHFRIYSTNLTSAQMDMLRRGFEPDRAHLVGYWPLMGDPVSGADPIGGNTMTLSSVAASATVQPPIVRPWAWWALLLTPWRLAP